LKEAVENCLNRHNPATAYVFRFDDYDNVLFTFGYLFDFEVPFSTGYDGFKVDKVSIFNIRKKDKSMTQKCYNEDSKRSLIYLRDTKTFLSSMQPSSIRKMSIQSGPNPLSSKRDEEPH